MKKKLFVVLTIGFFTFVTVGMVSATNLLTNPGFETGDFSSWTVGGNSPSYGVDIDGTPIQGVNPGFVPTYINVHSGNYAGFALVKEFDGIERILLSQSVNILSNQNYDVGFWVGQDDANDGFGFNIGDPYLEIYVNGIGLTPVINQNQWSPDGFLGFSDSFNSGSMTTVEITFAITGSGTWRAGISFDDFFLNGESPAAPVPEPATMLLLGSGLAGLAGFRKRFNKS